MLLSFKLSVQDCWWTWQHGNIRSLTTRGAICPHPIDHCALDAVCNVVQHLYNMAKRYVPGSVSILQFSSFTKISSSVECRMPKVTIAGGPERSKTSDGFYSHHNHMQSLFEAIVVGLALLGMLVRALESIFILHFFYIPSEFFRHFPCAAHHFLKIWMCQDLHERQQAFVFGGGVYFDCLSHNVLDSRRSAINKSSMKFHRSPWFQTFQCECLWFLQVIFALTWFIVVVMGWACGTLADLLLATQQLSRILMRFFSEILSTPKDWSHRSHCTHCLHWLCLEPPKSDRWMSLCRGKWWSHSAGNVSPRLWPIRYTSPTGEPGWILLWCVHLFNVSVYPRKLLFIMSLQEKLLVSKYASIIQSIQSCITHDHNRCAVHHCLSHEFHSAKSESFLLQVW